MYLAELHIDEIYPQLLQQLLTNGQKISPRGLETRELRGVTIEIYDAQNNILSLPGRKLNYSFSVAEWLWILLGQNDVDSITVFNKNLAQFSDDGRTFRGAYGPRIADQLPWVVDTLKRDPSSRQAVLTLWRPRPGDSKDIPCTVSMQFMLRPSGLEMITYMRSNDAWLGFPYDIFNFTQIQNYVAVLLGVDIGRYVHMVGSMHIYETHYDAAWSLLADADPCLNLESPRLTPMPLQVRAWFNDTAFRIREKLEPVPIIAGIEPWANYLNVVGARQDEFMRQAVRHPYTELVNR